MARTFYNPQMTWLSAELSAYLTVGIYEQSLLLAQPLVKAHLLLKFTSFDNKISFFLSMDLLSRRFREKRRKSRKEIKTGKGFHYQAFEEMVKMSISPSLRLP